MALKQLYENADTYKALLRATIKEASVTEGSKLKQLCLFAQPDRVRVATSVHQPSIAGRADLVFHVDPEKPEEREEVICHVQGYALRVNLPPITARNQLTKHPLTAKQAIVLTGLGEDRFDQCARAILEVHAKLSATLPPNSLQEWTPLTDSGKICLEFSNRYFASNADGQQHTDIPLSSTIDPFGILAKEIPNGRHTEDNQVLYFDRVARADNRGHKHILCNPSAVRVGQIVEAQVAFCAVPIGKGKFRMLTKLRALCILSRQLQKDLDDGIIRRLRESLPSPLKKVKRNVGYDAHDTEDEASTEAELKRLKLHDKDGEDGMSL